MYDWPGWVLLHSERQGECLIWRGEFRSKDALCWFTLPDGKRVNVRLFLMHEPGDPHVKRFRTSCGYRRCIHPAHQAWQFFRGPGVDLSGACPSGLLERP